MNTAQLGLVISLCYLARASIFINYDRSSHTTAPVKYEDSWLQPFAIYTPVSMPTFYWFVWERFLRPLHIDQWMENDQFVGAVQELDEGATRLRDKIINLAFFSINPPDEEGIRALQAEVGRFLTLLDSFPGIGSKESLLYAVLMGFLYPTGSVWLEFGPKDQVLPDHVLPLCETVAGLVGTLKNLHVSVRRSVEKKRSTITSPFNIHGIKLTFFAHGRNYRSISREFRKYALDAIQRPEYIESADFAAIRQCMQGKVISFACDIIRVEGEEGKGLVRLSSRSKILTDKIMYPSMGLMMAEVRHALTANGYLTPTHYHPILPAAISAHNRQNSALLSLTSEILNTIMRYVHAEGTQTGILRTCKGLSLNLEYTLTADPRALARLVAFRTNVSIYRIKEWLLATIIGGLASAAQPKAIGPVFAKFLAHVLASLYPYSRRDTLRCSMADKEIPAHLAQHVNNDVLEVLKMIRKSSAK